MADVWKNYKQTIANKRTGKKKTPSNDILKKEEIVVQRLSTEVAGKAQKYSRIGPSEFVPYEYDEITISNIEKACMKYFASTIGKNMACDIVAGEQGPSCTSLDHIPDLRVVHIRFVEAQGVSITEVPRPPKRKYVETASAKWSPCNKQSSPIKHCPKSLSVLEMLKLGKVIKEKSSYDSIELFAFDINEMAWCRDSTVQFSIAKEPIGQGGFCEAFKATSKAGEFKSRDWVVKKYLQSTEDTIAKQIRLLNNILQKSFRCTCWLELLHRNSSRSWKKNLNEFYGTTLMFRKIFMGKMEGEQWVTVEEFIDGNFTKYINNTGMVCGVASEVRDKCENLAHFSYERSNKELMVIDMQGSGHSYDPEIASKDLRDGEEVLFSTGNLSTMAINNFVDNHVCNEYCTLLGLNKL